MMGKWVDRHSRGIIFALAALLGALLTGCVMCQAGDARMARAQQHLSEEVLRFHVLANSDSEEDQRIKLLVRDAVLDYLEDEMPRSESAKDTARWVKEHREEIESVGRAVLRKNGDGHDVSAAVTTCYFPDRSYGEVTFPAGNYRALRIEVGDGEGQNWWCVLYPNLCFLDAVNAVFPDAGREKLKNVLTEEEYSAIRATSDFKINWFFWRGKER